MALADFSRGADLLSSHDGGIRIGSGVWRVVSGTMVIARPPAVLSLLSLLVALFLTAPPASATTTARPAAPADVCWSAQLSTARVSSWILLEHGDRTYTKIRTEFRVVVPGDWPLVRDLLLSEESPAYIRAMSCLTRAHPGQYRRWSEWREGPPVITSEKDGGVTVADRTHAWVNTHEGPIDTGVWRVSAGRGEWTIRLLPPPALIGARWDEIKVDPGGPGARTAIPRPGKGEGATALVWHPATPGGEKADESRSGPGQRPSRTHAAGKETSTTASVPAVTVRLQPSWQRSWAAQSNRWTAVLLDRTGSVIAAVLTGSLLLRGVVLYRRRSAPLSVVRDRTLRNLTRWAVVLVLLALLTDGRAVLQRYEETRDLLLWPPELVLRDHGFALAVVAVLFSLGLPPRRFWVLIAALSAPPLLVAAVPDAFDLGHGGLAEASAVALAAETTASASLFALSTLAFTAAAWRLATDGELLPKSRRRPGSDRLLRLRVAGPAVLAWTVLVTAFFALTEERAWQRATWLSDRTVPDYGRDHMNDFVWEAMASVPQAQDVLSWYVWMLTGVAVLAVLRAWRSSTAVSPLEEPADRILFLTFFAAVVPLIGGYVVGNSAATALWILLGMLALYGLVAPFAGRSVLAQPLELSGRPLTSAAAAPGGRTALLEKARFYREIHAELRRLDQGLFGDVPPKRSDLEQRLDDLHDWPAHPPSSGAPDRLPARISVVDAALALGPRDTWWANGSRCARLSLIPALPASVLMVWVWGIRGDGWTSVLSNHFGVPGLVLDFLGWTATWTGAAFVLGALWRLLPGRRGAAKALPVTAAFALPAAADSLVLHFTDESTAGLALAVSAMLLVLTVTGIAVDFDTFRTEQRYWQSRLGLLLSIYQMRYYSLQFAYLIAQIVAMISIWQFLSEPDAAPQPPEPKG
ncbi:DUF6185 family protein [Streptomyces sp. NPDC035033]|uniref:DUF6185 family protein n=1 Tax=Streptomyces sp. NPDC035033 TaxID=3155368 RepID=UPI0034082107